jgi:hypothetical protein
MTGKRDAGRIDFLNLHYLTKERRFSRVNMPDALPMRNDSAELTAFLLEEKTQNKDAEDIDAAYQALFNHCPLEPNAFTQLVIDHMARIGCANADQFELTTLLDKTFFFQIMRHDKRDWSVNTILSIMAGFGLNHLEAEELLAAANKKLQPDKYKNDRVYSYLIAKMQGQSIAKWNSFLMRHGLPPLGSKKRK